MANREPNTSRYDPENGTLLSRISRVSLLKRLFTEQHMVGSWGNGLATDGIPWGRCTDVDVTYPGQQSRRGGVTDKKLLPGSRSPPCHLIRNYDSP